MVDSAGEARDSAIVMKARLGLNATATVKKPTGEVKQSSPITPEQFAGKANAMPMLNTANHVAGEAMRAREINTGLRGQEQPVPSLTETAKDRVARMGKGKTKEQIFK
jgi:hypothetical protein